MTEDPDVVARVRADPRSFLDSLTLTVILDGMQNAPELFAYVHARIDRHPERKGQRLLSGSQEAALLGIRNEADLAVSPFRGPLFEGLVASEIVKHRLNRGREHILLVNEKKGYELAPYSEIPNVAGGAVRAFLFDRSGFVFFVLRGTPTSGIFILFFEICSSVSCLYSLYPQDRLVRAGLLFAGSLYRDA